MMPRQWLSIAFLTMLLKWSDQGLLSLASAFTGHAICSFDIPACQSKALRLPIPVLPGRTGKQVPVYPSNTFLLDSVKGSVDSITGDSAFSSSQSQNDAETTQEQATAPKEYFKRELLQLAASYDRGFGASLLARNKVNAVIQNLEREYDVTLSSAADSILSSATAMSDVSLIGNWRMIWTTALDVLSLSASPFFTPGAIYQVFDGSGNRRVTNVIDFIPRVQALFPIQTPTTLIRAKVQTRACLPRRITVFDNSNPLFAMNRDNGNANGSNDSVKPNRVGLIFEAVSVQPVQLLGFDSGLFPPLSFDLPKLPGTDDTTSPGYFDVTFLDPELLVIRQNALDGLFCLIRCDSIDP